MIASPTELVYFLEVANTLNLTRAAEKLDISQPSLSMAIQRLEKSMGVQLIIRHKRGVNLTKAGKLLLIHAKELLQNWEKISSNIQAAHSEVHGRVTVGCHLSVAHHCIPKFLPGLLNKYPKLEIRMNHDFSYNLIDKIARFEIDIGILVNPIQQPDLIIRKIYDDYDTLWYASNKKFNTEENSHSILCDPERIQTQIILKKLKRAKINYSRIIASNSLEILAKLTATGCGIGILPALVVKSTCDKQVAPIISAPIFRDEICLVYRYENKDISTIQTVVRAIYEGLKK